MSCLSSFALRAAALFCMLVDHAGLALFPNIGLFRCVGRLSFPLYCFLLVQGCRHSRDSGAYARRLLLLAIVSEIPFDLLIFGRFPIGAEQNAVFSLLFGMIAALAAEACRARPARLVAFSLLLMLLAMLLRVSFGWLGVALCLAFALLDGRPLLQGAAAAGLEALYALSLFLSGVNPDWALVSLCGMLSAVPIALYNGKRGPRASLLTALFYAAYPAHLLALVALRMLRVVPPNFF